MLTHFLTIASSPQAAAVARAFLREVIEQDLPTDVMGSVLLLTTELVTNATRHSGSPLGAGIEVILDLDARAVRVAVLDEGAGFDPDQPRVIRDTGGWGLFLIRTLASRWGVETRGSKTEVWFELEMNS